MRKRKFAEAQLIAALEANEAGREAEDVCRELGTAAATLYAWSKKDGGLETSELERLRELEAENAPLKAMYAEASLDIHLR